MPKKKGAKTQETAQQQSAVQEQTSSLDDQQTENTTKRPGHLSEKQLGKKTAGSQGLHYLRSSWAEANGKNTQS